VSYKSGGTGLGLFQAKEAAISMGGDIKVHSKIGLGTTFEILVPAFDQRMNIPIPPDTPLVFLDDDILIHKLWKEHIPDNISTFFFSDVAEFFRWREDNQRLQAIYFIDHDLPGLGAGIFMPDQTYKPIGAISKYTCFSFQTIKFLTTGDGGAIGTTDPEIAARLRRLRWFGFDRKTMKKHYEGDRDCSLTELGYKYHMNNINAAIGLGALKDARKRLARRREIAGAFRCMLNNVPGLTLLEKGWEYDHSYWVFTILVENRLRFIQLMRDVGDIPVSVMDRRIDVHPIFGGKTKNLVGQEEFDKKQISIPVHDELKDEEIDKIIKTIWRGW
jgi:hypothetical protein